MESMPFWIHMELRPPTDLVIRTLMVVQKSSYLCCQSHPLAGYLTEITWPHLSLILRTTMDAICAIFLTLVIVLVF